MRIDKHTVKVKIMQREFTVACNEGEGKGLIEAANYLNEQMLTIAKKHQALGVDRCAIMAALNISHELLQLRKDRDLDKEVATRLERIQDKIDETMNTIQPEG